jgi:hypothetical protein
MNYNPGIIDDKKFYAIPRFKQQVINKFNDNKNIDYLRFILNRDLINCRQKSYILTNLVSNVDKFAKTYGVSYDILDSDDTAMRGYNSVSSDIWAEVKRLNRNFYDYCVNEVKNITVLNKHVTPELDDEPYHMRMFIADSLRPPGLEFLNSPGPLHEIKEDQAINKKVPHIISDCDDAWDIGRLNRTPERAIAEYYGDHSVRSCTAIGAPEVSGVTYGSLYCWGNQWEDNGGTRFMRYEKIPFWHECRREGCDRDIEENLGQSYREMDGHIRRWDGLERKTEKNGQSYRRYGPTSGYIF